MTHTNPLLWPVTVAVVAAVVPALTAAILINGVLASVGLPLSLVVILLAAVVLFAALVAVSPWAAGRRLWLAPALLTLVVLVAYVVVLVAGSAWPSWLGPQLTVVVIALIAGALAAVPIRRVA